MAGAQIDVAQRHVGDEVSLTTLPSGVRVVTEAMPDVRSATIGFWVDCGSRDEQGPVAGASHFLEHLLFKGTQRRSALEIAEIMDAVGGDMNAFTSKEYTCFYARCLDRDLPLAVDVLGDMITSATIDAADVDGERNVVLEEIRMHLDTPDDLVHSVFAEAYFGEHALGREVLGSEQTISQMARDQVDAYYRGHYTPANLVVAAAGNLTHDRVVDLVGEALEGLRPGERTAKQRVAPNGRANALAVRQRPTEQAHLLLGGRGLARTDERRFAVSVLNQALGGGMASRLFQEVRERRGLAYSVYSYHSMHADSGTFAVYAGTAPARTEQVLDVVRDELGKALHDGLSADELARAKGHLTGSTVLALEDTGSRMSRLGKSATTGTPLLTLDETLAAVDAVTTEQVAEVSEELLSGPFSLAVVGPFDESAATDFERYTRASQGRAAAQRAEDGPARAGQ